jgi:hypothetical protein
MILYTYDHPMILSFVERLDRFDSDLIVFFFFFFFFFFFLNVCVNMLMNINQDLEGLAVWWLGLLCRETMLSSSLLTIPSSPPTTWYHYCLPFSVAMDRVVLSQWFG